MFKMHNLLFNFARYTTAIILSKYLAVKRRLHIFIYKDFNPYPKINKDINLSPSKIHQNYYNNITPKFIFNSSDFNKELFQKEVRNKIKDLISFRHDLNLKVLESKEYIFKKKYLRKRILVNLERNRDIPIETLELIDGKNDKKGMMVCLQGTNSGAHLNFGEFRMPADPFKVYAGSSLALQAADNGYLAISFDRIGYGERRETELKKQSLLPVVDTSLHSLALGNSLLGETISEIYTISKWFKNKYRYPLWLVGYSSAGSVASVAGALFDDDIDGICIGGCIGPFKDTILIRGATAHLEIQECIKWFGQEILLQLMAPRSCIVIAGTKDHIWPYDGAKVIYDKSKSIYELYLAQNRLELIKVNGVHTYYPELMWESINRHIDVY